MKKRDFFLLGLMALLLSVTLHIQVKETQQKNIKRL